MTYREFLFLSEEGLSISEIKFADAYTQNPDLLEAAREAGYEDEVTMKAWAKATLSKPMVKRRIEDNLAMARRSSVASVRERRELLSSIMRSSIVDCVTIHNGKMEIDLEKAKRMGSHKSIQTIKIDDKEDEKGSSHSRAISMLNPMSAISELNKMDDLYNKKVNRTGAIILVPAEDLGV
jgi:hypothetical protein